ncbi:UNVERIFIED_CONTAM: hypothetical protein FKN15_027613 [Acipenser sinensis]
MEENLTFPVYKVEEILAFLRSDVLAGPEARNFTKSDIVPTPKMPVNENIQHPLIYEGILPIASIYLRMCQFLPMCHVYDFQMNDLLNPKAKRTIFILCGIMNFLHFRNLRREIYLDHLQGYKSAVEKSQSIAKGINEAELKITKLTTIPPQQQAEFKELSAAVTDLHHAMSQESQAVNSINEEIAQLKSEHAEKTLKLNNKKVDLATLKEDQARLKSLIVESPEELRNEKEKMKETVKKIKQTIEKTNVNLVELQNKIQGSVKCQEEFQSFYKLQLDLQGGMEKMNSLIAEIRNINDVVERQRKDLKNMSTDETQFKRAVGMKMDKKTKLQIRRQKKQEVKDQQVQIVFSDMEINTFPEFKVDEILAFLQNDVLDGPDARSILKSDIVPNPKVPVNEHIQYPVLLEGFLPICNIYLRMTIPPEQQAEFNKLSSEILDLQNAMSQESQRVNAVNEQIAQRKCEHSEVTQMLSKKKVDLATLKEDHIKLESLIVESPEELRNEKEKLKETVKKIKQSIDNKNVVLVELQNKNQTSSLCHGTLESFYKLLEDLQGLVEKMNVLQSEIHDLTDGIERQRKDLKNMSTDETQYKRAVGMKMDKKTKLQIRRQKKQEVKDQQVQIVFSECNQVQEKREDILKHMKQIDCETQQIRATIQLLTETCTHETEKAQVGI